MSAVANGCLRVELQAFNRFKIFSCVWFISDMATGEGKKILPEVLQGMTRIASNLNWPQQQHPGKRDWKVWRKILQRDILTDAENLWM